jgi:hypothetical protein
MTGNDRRKSRRISAGEGLANMASSMQATMQTLAGLIVSTNRSGAVDPSTWKAAAIAAIEEDEGLAEDKFNVAVEMIIVSSEAATMYLAIKKDSAHMRFLQSQLKKFRTVD